MIRGHTSGSRDEEYQDWGSCKMKIYFSGGMDMKVSPERILYDKKPGVMLTYWELKQGVSGATIRMKDHMKKERQEGKRNESSS